MSGHPAKVSIVNKAGEVFECKGQFYTDGRILCLHEGKKLLIDPEWYNPKDARRLMVYKEGRWSPYLLKSVVLDGKLLKSES
jgi:hypothetical protein